MCIRDRKVSGGRITLGSEQGVEVSNVAGQVETGQTTEEAGRTSARSITVRGTRAAIVDALDGLFYLTRLTTDDKLQIVYNDLGHDGEFDPIKTEHVVAIKLPDAPATPGTPPSEGLAEVETEGGQVWVGWLLAGTLGWFFRKPKPQSPNRRRAA